MCVCVCVLRLGGGGEGGEGGWERREELLNLTKQVMSLMDISELLTYLSMKNNQLYLSRGTVCMCVLWVGRGRGEVGRRERKVELWHLMKQVTSLIDSSGAAPVGRYIVCLRPLSLSVCVSCLFVSLYLCDEFILCVCVCVCACACVRARACLRACVCVAF